MKIVTLCGSLKFQKEMMTVAEKMALEGYCVLTPVYPVSENMERTKEQLINLKEAHFKRIELSDAILVVNINPSKSIPIKVIDNHFPTFVNKLSLYLIDNISAGIKNINE